MKRKRPRERSTQTPAAEGSRQQENGPRREEDAEDDDDDDEDDGVEFEDVSLPTPTLQTITRNSDDEEENEGGDDEDVPFEDVDFDFEALQSIPAPLGDQPMDLNLNLTAQKEAMTPRRSADRRKPVTKEEKSRRVEVHKVHLLCLLSHVALRNRWCNSPEVQDALRPLLSEKMIKYLNPGSQLSQFGRTESLKNGLQQVGDMFRIKFAITERGIRRALWAEDSHQLQDVHDSDYLVMAPLLMIQ